MKTPEEESQFEPGGVLDSLESSDFLESSGSLRVHVLLFGAAREIVKHRELDLELQSPATASVAFQALFSKYPELRRFGKSLLLSVNQEYATMDRELRDGDELGIFPPVSGGSRVANSDFFQLTNEPIEIGLVARCVTPAECGATVTLDGYVREWTRGRRTLYLVYEAYPEMALSEMKRLGSEAHEMFDIAHIGIVHRTGRLEIGETSVCIAVSAPHRRAAFQACEWAIKELKRRVPIWKKEFFEDGEVWAEGECATEAVPQQTRHD